MYVMCVHVALGLCTAQAAGLLESAWAGGLRWAFSGQLQVRITLECNGKAFNSLDSFLYL